MSKGSSVVRRVVPVFFAANLFALFYGVISGHMEYFYLSILLGGPFLLGLVLAATTRSHLLIILALAAFVSGWLAPLGFFWERDKYTYGGFSAVRDFQFSAVEYLGFYVPIIAGYFMTLLIGMTPYLGHKRAAGAPMAAPGGADSTSRPRVPDPRVHATSGHPRLVFTTAILVFAAINWWMFNNSIGLTGINPPELPFKLSGILYYLARFVFPAVLIFLLTRFRPTSLDLTVLVAYACFASLTSVSKTTLFLLFLPALITSFLNKQYVFLASALVLLALFYPVVNVARNFVYLVDEGLSVRNLDFSLIEVLFNSFIEYNSEDLLSGPISIIERIGGGQDVALAAQYNSDLVAGPMAEFVRLYIFDFWGLASAAQEQMYAYQPDVAGFATGDGGFFAHMLLASGGSVLMVLPVSVYLGLFLALGNSTYLHLLKCGVPRELVLFYAILFCIFFFALSIPLWLNVFVIVTSIGSRTKAFNSFARRRLQRPVLFQSGVVPHLRR